MSKTNMIITNNGSIGKAITVTGNNVVISGNKLFVDGKEVDLPEAKVFNILVEGSLDKLQVDVAELITVQGNCQTVSTVNGNVNTAGDINVVTTTNGSVHGRNITGTVNTVNGDINNFNK